MGSRAESHELKTPLNNDCRDLNSTLGLEALGVADSSTVPKSAQSAQISRPAPAKLSRQTYLLFPVSLYSCLSIIAWTIICIQTKRPITTHTYSYDSNADDYDGVLANQMKSNAEWFRAAKILLTITNTLIIPLTSTVCASAAVIYVQNFGRRRCFSMQHTATLADKGWSSPQVWLALLSVKGWKSQGSYFLVFAMGLHALGFLIGPLQQYYIEQETFKFQTVQRPGFLGGTDIFDILPYGPVGFNSLQNMRLQNELASVSQDDLQPNIWQEGTPHCLSNSSNNFEVSPECSQGGVTFGNLTALQGPYVAQLPADYQTGLMSQFMLRMNSSVSFLNVSKTAFPSNCNAIPSAYYIEYSYDTTPLNIQVCMLDGISQSPWKGTRDRQDIRETMFLNIELDTSGAALHNADAGYVYIYNITFKLTVDTTLGYFELPNYNSSGMAGPLLAKDPHDTCPGNEGQCRSQWHSKRSLQTNESQTSFAYNASRNIGPLAMIVTALFEPGSFIATQIHQNATTAPDMYIPDPGQAIPCTAPPLNWLAGDPQCFPQLSSAGQGYLSVAQWLSKFYEIGDMQKALHAAVILASQVWLNLPGGNLMVYYDMGRDSIRPRISSAGMILLSILLALDVLLLLVIAIYISFSYTWAEDFDSSAMMRLGAARADELRLQVISREGKEKTRAILERMPGWVGDARPDDEVGALAIGATVPLTAGRRYQAS